jgi:predicted AAA+ superfamily ATPase
MYARRLNLKKLLNQANYFLFGPRSTGKSSLIKAQLSPDAEVFDLLDDDVYESFLRRPKSLEERVKNWKSLIVIDEIQRLPLLLNEVHRMIEKRKARFLLTGSSARKLRRGMANMLGGRAREANLFPLVSAEIDDFDLIKYLRFGGLPIVYQSKQPMEDLKAYCRVYLNEEIKAEAAVRNYERFVRFLEVMALCNGQEINYHNISSDSGVPARTIEGHIEVLKDTLLAFELPPFAKNLKRKAGTRSKFYFFDTGVANYLGQKLPMGEGSADLGTSFEQFIIQEVRAYLSYNSIDKKLSFWRSKEFEVDLIIGNDVAVEIKFSKNIKDEFFKGLLAFKEEKPVKKYYLVSRSLDAGETNGVHYLPYDLFLKNLWRGEIV